MNERIERYFKEEMTADERFSFLKELESNRQLQAEYSEYQNAIALLAFSEAVSNESNSKASFQTFTRRIKQRGIQKRLLKTITYAASITILLLSVHFLHVYFFKPSLKISEASLFVPAGQRVSLTLEDGTVVWLNARSRLTYPTAFIGDERNVSVEGEAYFIVAEDKDRPFVVSCKDAKMKVLGTSFNVYSYPDDSTSRISLQEGSLLVYQTENISKQITLKPHEEVIVDKNNLSVHEIPSDDYFLWKEGIYSFDGETLAHVFKKLERYYDIEIIVKDPQILEWKYTVKFRQRDGIDEILRLIQKIHSIQIVKDEEKNQIIISR